MRTQRVARLILGLCLTLAAPVIVGCKSSVPESAGNQFIELPVGSFAEAWKAELGIDGVVNGVYLLRDRLYVTSTSNQMYALTANGGTVLSVVRTASPAETPRPPVALRDRVVVAHADVLSFYDLNGNPIRDIRLGTPIRSNLAAFRDYLVFGVSGAGGGRLTLVDPSKRYVPVIWEVTTGLITGAPATFGDLCFAGSELGRVYACDVRKTRAWNLEGGYFVTDRGIKADLVADDYGVYVASLDTKLYCLDRLTGKIRWIYHAGAPLEQAPVVTADAVYVIHPDRGLVALQKSGPKRFREAMWEVSGIRQVVSTDEQHVYVVRSDNTLLALDKQTGKMRFSSVRTDLTHFATNLQSATIYAATSSGETLAIRPVLRSGTVGTQVALPVDGPALARR